MITIRKLKKKEIAMLDERIKITKDHEAIKILGTLIGNKTNASASLEPVIDKINKLLTETANYT